MRTTPRPARTTSAALVLLAAAAACGGDADESAERVDPSPPPSSPAAADTTPTADTAPAAADAAPSDSIPWETPPLRRVPDGSQRGVALLTGVRTGRHDGYDRIVFEFAEHIPEYTIRYVQDPVACGSGEPVDAGARAALEVDLRPAAAHDDEGRPTFGERRRLPGLPTLRTARITCDFEAIVTWVLGLDVRSDVRALELSSPPRLVVDLRHR